jgi:tetratricopeptide (TPR) repeat protein
MRDRVSLSETPRRIIKWTVSLTVIVGLIAYWQFAHDRPEYVLRKTVIDHPLDRNAWLELAWHYKYEGDTLAADSGDEDHSPPDPTSSYQEALDCFNQAVHLGATGFEVQFARAQLSDAIGETQASVSFGRDALRFAPSPMSGGDGNDDIKWLREMIARNAAAPTGPEGKEDRKQRVRDRRRKGLPGIARWPFDLIDARE